MESKVQKWGNSHGIRIPKVYLDALDLKNNDSVEIEQIDKKIIITKGTKSFKERVEAYKGPNLCEDFIWDEPVGKEIW